MEAPHLAAPQSAPDLYRAILGPAWPALDPVLQTSYSLRGERRRSGVLQVRRGGGWIAGLLAWLLGLPSPGAGVPARLVIRPERGGEIWSRAIGDGSIVTSQRAGKPGRLIERFGCLELTFALGAANGGIDFMQRGAALACGGLRLPLPAWLAPRVEAREEPAGDGRCTRVRVRIALPLAGCLADYRGRMAAEDESC